MKKQKAMLKQLKSQRGASFVGWMVIAAVMVFLMVTAAKIAPVYMEFATVRSLVDEIAADDAFSGPINSQVLRRKLGDYMNVNALHTVQPEHFSVVRMAENKNARALQVEYEVRKPWLANIDFMMDFHHVAEFKRQN